MNKSVAHTKGCANTLISSILETPYEGVLQNYS